MKNDNYTDHKYKGFTIRIEQDDDCGEGPREWDNLGTIVSWHRRSWIGDTTVGQSQHSKQTHCKYQFDTHEDLFHFLKTHDVFCLAIYIYEHSGITIRTGGPFGIAFDSGQVGYIFVEKEDVRKEWKVKRISSKLKEIVKRNLESEVKILDQWMNGDVWGYKIFSPDDPDCENELDSVWNYYGDDYCLEQAKEAVEYHLKEYNKMIADQEQAKWDNVPQEEVYA